MILYALFSLFLMADPEDPKGYFLDRLWTLALSPTSNIKGQSEFKGEPKKAPNRLNVFVDCGDEKKLKIIKNLKYCGVDAMKLIGGKLEIQFTDFAFKGDQGYCFKKRTKLYSVPRCP